MTLLVATANWAADVWAERFAAALPGRRILVLGDDYEPADIRYVAAWKQPAGALRGLAGLKAVFGLGAGVDYLMEDPDLPAGVPVVRVIDPDLTHRMSEYVVLHCLAHLRQFRRYEAQQRDRVWDDDRDQPAARDVRVGLLGLGELGTDAACKLAMMGFKVAGWTRSPRSVQGIETFAGEAGLTPFLARTDILVVLLPLTPATEGIVDARMLAGLARDGRLGGPILINAGRGRLQVEADILAALEAGTLKAATLDVFQTEPLPAGSPLWSHPAVTVTPHNAAMSEPSAVTAHVARQIARIEAGEMPEGLVDRASGY